MNQYDIQQRSNKIKTYFPVLIFIVFIFLLEAFQIAKATALLISAFFSLLSIGILIVKIHQKSGDLMALKPVIFMFGILTLIFGFIIGVAIMHQYQVGHLNLRWGLFFFTMLVYLIFLFRALHQLKEIRDEFNSQK